MERDILNSCLVIAGGLLAAAFLFSSRMRRSSEWRATVTPLASIIGSGFLVLAPILDRGFGKYAALMMLALCLLAFLLGAAIRHNIRHFESRSDAPRSARWIDELAHWSLAVAYIISVAYYLNLFGSFAMALTPFKQDWAARGVTTAILVFIGIWGRWHGLSGLERLEKWTVALKLCVIAGLLAGLAMYAGERAHHSALVINPVTLHGWSAVTLGFGVLITVQGFETSRYLSAEYDPEHRARTMRNSQLLSTAIYLVYIGLTSFTIDASGIGRGDTAVIAMTRQIAPVLPALLVAAALAAQFSAAAADTIGCGGLAEEASRKRISSRNAYLLLAIFGIVLTWVADVFQIIAYASRAFAFYYTLQCLIAARTSWSGSDDKSRSRIRAGGFALLALVAAAVCAFGRPAE